jgi:MFS family permease
MMPNERLQFERSSETTMPAHQGRWRDLALVSLASLGWAFSFGLGAPLSALWLRDAGCSASAIGLNTALYYLGVALASPFVPALMLRANRSCVIAGMLLDAGTTALFPLCHGLPAWHALRFVGGVGTALSLIPMETLVNHNAPAEHRARDFGIYAVCVALGIALGAVVGLPLYPHVPKLAFALGGAVTLAATALAWMVMPAIGESANGGREGDTSWRANLLGFGTAWVQGFLEGGTLTFLSMYLLSLGHGESVVSALMGGLFAGVVVAQLPVAWLADRLGRKRVLLACHVLLLAGLTLVPLTRPVGLVAGWLFVLGACCGALYPLGLSLLGERIAPSALAKANAWYLACNCAGSLSGPLVIGLAIDGFGLAAQFVVGGVGVLVVLTLGLGSGRSRSAPREDESRRAA